MYVYLCISDTHYSPYITYAVKHREAESKRLREAVTFSSGPQWQW